jgi:hypothetical protein
VLLAGRAPHDAEPAQGRGLLELGGQVLEQARGRDGRLQLQPCDQPVNDHMGEPFDLRIDGSDRLVRELFGGTGEGAHALINSSVTLEAGMMGLESSVKWRGTDKVRATSHALPRVYARCLPEDALPHGARQGFWTLNRQIRTIAVVIWDAYGKCCARRSDWSAVQRPDCQRDCHHRAS